MKYCSRCGTALDDNVAFCTNCGNAAPNPPYPYVVYQPVVYARPKIPGRGLGIASLVLGIIGIFYSFVVFCGALSLTLITQYYDTLAAGFYIICIIVYWVFPLLALIFSLVSRHKGFKAGISTAGLVLGILGNLFIIASFALIAISIACL